MLSGLGYDLGLDIMIFGIQYLMLDTLTLKHLAQHLGGLDRDRTDQYRLMLFVCCDDILYHSMEFLFLGHIYGIVVVDTGYRTVCRDLDNVHAVDLTELLLLGKSCTGHTGLLIVLVEEVLEGNGGQCLGLTAYLYMLLCLDRLMQTVGITASRHDTAGKFIDDQDLIIFDHVILILEHQIMGTQGKNDIVLDLKVFRIGKVLDMEELLDFLDTLLCQIDDLVLFIDDEIAGLGDFFAHDGGHLGHFAAGFTALELSGEDIAGLIQLGGLATLTGNDQRGTGFIDQNGVDLIDDGIMQATLYQLFFIDDHVVTQVIETEFVVGDVGDIAVIGFTTFFRGHGV